MKTNLSAVVAASLALVNAGVLAQSNAPTAVVPAASSDAASRQGGEAIAQAFGTNLPPNTTPTPHANRPAAQVQTSRAPIPVSPNAYEAGRAEARRDLRAGLLRLRGYGLASRPSRRYTEGLRRPVEVPVQAVAGCVVTEELIQQVRGYNQVMEAEIQRQIRNGTLERAVRAANPASQVRAGAVLLPADSATIQVHSNQPLAH